MRDGEKPQSPSTIIHSNRRELQRLLDIFWLQTRIFILPRVHTLSDHSNKRSYWDAQPRMQGAPPICSGLAVIRSNVIVYPYRFSVVSSSPP